MIRTYTDIENPLIREIPTKIIIYIKRNKINKDKCYSDNIAREIESSRSHTVKMVKKLEEEGIVERKKKGRKNIITLTEKGTKLAEHLEKCVSIMQGE